MSRLKRFLEKLGIEPRDMGHYRRALTHASATPDPSENYERLEFLGDSIIGMVISDFLFTKFPEKEEGELTRIKAMVVSRESLGESAAELKLDKHLRADTARMRNGSPAEVSILSDCFESLVGAIFIDRKYLAVRRFILDNLSEKCIALSDIEGPTDFKSRLQELWQHRHKDTPVYRVVEEIGPDHDKIFTIEVKFGRRLLGRGSGSSKKKAEQEAAEDALERDRIKREKGKSGSQKGKKREKS